MTFLFSYMTVYKTQRVDLKHSNIVFSKPLYWIKLKNIAFEIFSKVPTGDNCTT